MELPGQDSAGFKLYVEKCGICHPAQHPQILSFKAWQRMVPKMEKKLKEMPVREPLTEEETAVILGYLKEHSRARGF